MKKKLLFALIVSALIVLLCGAALAGTPDDPCSVCGDRSDGWTDWEYDEFFGSNDHRKTCKHCYNCHYYASCNSAIVTGEIKPSCTKDGSTGKFTCSLCGHVTQEAQTIPATGHEPGAEATCTKDQTCTVCGEILSPATGHDYKAIKKVAPSCTDDGYTEFECANCKDSTRGNYTEPLKHWFKLWNANEDGTHSAECKREGCEFIGKNECTAWEVTSGENILTVCPVCGRFDAGNFEAIAEAGIEGAQASSGEIIVCGMKAPFDGALYAFTAGYEYSGRMQPFTQAAKISLPLDSAEYADCKLVRVDVTAASEAAERTEAWTELSYSFENGVLSFESECEGLFLLIPTEAQA